MQRGVTAGGAADARVVVTGNFDRAVRRLTGSMTYASQRGSGVVAAKTIPTAAGSVVVVNNDATKELTEQ